MVNTTKDTFTIVKRNGTVVPFRKERIFKAIELALRETKKVSRKIPLSAKLNEIATEVTRQVVLQLFELVSKNTPLTVEGIQDIVEMTLMKNGYHDVAKSYIIYRDHHKEMRSDDPSNLKIIRQDNEVVQFNSIKVFALVEGVFKKAHQIEGTISAKLTLIVKEVTDQVITDAIALAKKDKLHVYDIQDLLEKALMQLGYFKEAKAYILYRLEQREEKEEILLDKAQKRRIFKDSERKFEIETSSGDKKTITETYLLDRLDQACRGYEKMINPEDLLNSAILNFYEGIKEEEIDRALIMATKAKIEKDPLYSKVAARLLLDKIYREALGSDTLDQNFEKKHLNYFKQYIAHGIKIEQISAELAKFDLDALAKVIKIERDDKFHYLGLQTLYDRYLIHENNRRLETPQIFWMRIAMGLAINEEDKLKHTIAFYEILSKHEYLCATPTLFNAGTTHSQLSSCYVSTIMDDLKHIFKTISDDAQLSKWAGGLGNDWTNVRGTGAYIKGTNGHSQGVIPFLKVANDTAVAVNQGGKRKGAMCAYLETWHIDIEDFIELRKNTGDERRRTHDMNTANWIPDLFIKRVKENGSWTLFSPNEVNDLHDLYGQAFEKQYVKYEQMADSGRIKLWKRVEAVQLWRSMLCMLFETGHPWITFKDPSNIRSPQDHVGVIHSSNLCTEILLNTSKEETAVCNLGSINLAEHVTEKGLDEEKLAKTVGIAIQMLDNVIDINFYPIHETYTTNIFHRPIGLGLMGFQDALNILGLSYASHEAVEFADKSMEMISYYAILSSSQLAKKRSPYPSYKGSKWERGFLPIDTIDLLEKERGEKVEMDRSSSMNWIKVRESIQKYGMRNSNVMAIAPTATIANIAGVTPSIEPNYKNLYAKSNLSGEFTFCNPYLVNKLKKLKLWDDEMIDDLKYFDGSILEIDRIPQDLKKQYLTAFEIDPEWIIECGSRRQKWIDQGQSLNLYLSEPSGKKLHNMYLFAWNKGLKTTYYCRTLGATQVEKSTLDINRRRVQPRWMKSESPSARVEMDRKQKVDIPVCSLEESCESCQ